MRDEYLQEAQTIVEDPNTLINLVSRRSKQLKHGSKPLIESLEKLEPEDIALREIIEGKITYQPWDQNSENWLIYTTGAYPVVKTSFHRNGQQEKILKLFAQFYQL